MAALHADNFSIYGTNIGFMLNGVYAEVDAALATDPDGVSSGYVLRCSAGGTNGNIMNLRYVLQNGAINTVGMAMRAWLPALPYLTTIGPRIMQLRNAANDNIAFLRVNATGTISLVDGVNAAVLGTTSVPVVTANGWYHYECKFTVTGTTISLELRVEGATVLTVTSAALFGTVAGPVASVCVCNNNSGANIGITYWVKDFVVWDTTGTINNNFLGSVLVKTLTITSDAALNWGVSTGTTGAPILDNIPPVDSQYMFAEDLPLPAAYNGVLSDLPVETTSVKALITYVRAGKSDGGDGSLQNGLISDPTGTPATVNGANRPITTAQTYWRDVFEIDPKTGLPWLPAAVNAARIRINRTT